MYNGIVLPALPGYNKSVYTHGFIQYGGVTGMEIYSLIVSTASGVMGDSYTVGEHTYSAWVVAANEESAANLSGAYPGISTKEWLQFEDGNTVTASTYDNIVWSDFDILKADGSVYLKASKPYDLESFKLGLSLGLCGNALPWKAEPVAWLYNGVRLPKLPDSELPYKVIVRTDSIAVGDSTVDGVRYWLYFTEEPCVHSLGNNIPIGSVRYVLYADKNTADICGSNVWGEWLEAEMNTAMSTFLAEYVWANADVLTANGGVKLSASEPIPVYE